MLQGACGNATLSAGGMVGLSDLLRSGQWLKLAKLVIELRERGHASLRGAASWAGSPMLPDWLRRRLSPELSDFDFSFSPVHPQQAAAYNLPQKRWQEFHGRDRSTEGFRRHMYEYYDIGFANVATTLGWQIECRDPTQDKRVFEYCYSIPIEQYLVGGQTRSLVRRAMRGRLPDSTLDRTTRGLQSADWFLTMGSRRKQMQEELLQLRKSSLANRLLDLDRLSKLLNDWPADGFDREPVIDSWCLALSRGLSVGNFIRQFE
jgi:asparagine synthase (glutamine-hydrolysing)